LIFVEQPQSMLFR